MQTRPHLFLPLLLTSLLASACGPEAPGTELRSDAERVDPDTLLTEADKELFVDGNTAFGLELYQAVSQGEDNVFLSPHSVSSALAMSYAGARTETEEAMREVMHYDLEGEATHAGFNWLDRELDSAEEMTLDVLNKLWARPDVEIEESWLDVLARHYDAGVQLLELVGAEDEINEWVSEATAGRIPDLLAPGSLGSNAKLVLPNAVYLKGGWATTFEASSTQDEAFTLLSGDAATVPMMRGLREDGSYAAGDGWEAAELRLPGDEARLLFVVPEEGRFADIDAGFDAAFLASVDEALQNDTTAGVQVAMPRFQIESGAPVGAALKSMGMEIAFEPEADFSGITPEELWIHDVVHKTFLAVDEEGVEAAGATAVIMGDDDDAAEIASIRIDRPFHVAIRHVETDALLFFGRVTDPS